MPAMEDQLSDLEAELLRRSFLYDPPSTFREAVRLAFAAVRETLQAEEPASPLRTAALMNV